MNRIFLLGTAWTASAASAVGLGFLAVSLVDASVTSSGTVPLAASTTATSSDDGGASSPASAPAGAVKTDYTVAGTVTASCASGTPVLSAAPATGWWLDGSDDADAGEVEFESDTQKLEVVVTCVEGTPVFRVEGPRADDGGKSGTDDTVAPAPVATDAPDDSDGRDGGGHGADDPAGDDSSGRGGGGHGSDDSGSGSDDSGSGSDDSGSGHGGGNSGSGGGDDSGGSGGHGSDD